jgi:hypothetical protein
MGAYIIGLRRSAPRGTAWVKEYLPKTAAEPGAPGMSPGGTGQFSDAK